LYVEALAGSMPLDRPIADDALRERLRREAAVHPAPALHQWLEAIAPESAARVTPGDRYRTVRALESALTARAGNAPVVHGARSAVDLTIAVLEIPRAVLDARIAQRVEAMFATGLVEEASAIRRAYGDAPALSGIGYAEALAYADGAATRAEALTAAINRTRSYSKRQQTWFRRISGARRLDALDARTAQALAELARGLRPTD
jgi:tRNA dimethylallyltransferase